jgi:WXXGXW repeat (2 copies)
MKKNIFSIVCISIVLFYSACSPAYVAEQPTHTEITRPPSPNDRHVWVDGDWVWNRRAHAYVREEGHWVVPDRGRTRVPGHWKTTRRGNHWVPGHWR